MTDEMDRLADPAKEIMDAAWPEFGGGAQTSDYWTGFGDAVSFTLAHAGRLVPATPTQSEDTRDQRLWWFLTILNGMGGVADTGDYSGNWLNTFCDDRPSGLDTFNLAIYLKLTRSSHNSDTDTGCVWLTDAGKARLASTPTPPAPSRDLVEAMRPFGRAFAAVCENDGRPVHADEPLTVDPVGLRVGDVWRLRAALAATQAPAEPGQDKVDAQIDHVTRKVLEAMSQARWNADHYGLPGYVRTALAGVWPPAEPSQGVEALREALEWYGEQARLCRLIHSEGDKGRHALSEDGGKRAKAALSQSAGGR